MVGMSSDTLREFFSKAVCQHQFFFMFQCLHQPVDRKCISKYRHGAVEMEFLLQALATGFALMGG